MDRILAINPGATSTKIAVFDNEIPVLKKTVEHQGQDLQLYSQIFDQYEYRLKFVLQALSEAKIELATLSAIVGRGGLLKSVAGGTYAVNQLMLDDLKKAERGEHASNLGAVMADHLARQLGIPAYIVDPVAVDEMEPVARISGLPDIPRASLSHALNSKAVARKVARDMGKRYEDVNLVVAHLGTGVSVSPHKHGRMIDVNNAQEEGPFSPDRCGGLPARLLVKLCFSGKYTEQELLGKLLGSGGIYAYLGTKDVREAEQRAAEGDELANTVLDAMSYQVAKEIGAMSAVLAGKVDSIVLTGGIAYSHRIVTAIRERVAYLAPIVVVPGEEEMESLTAGALRVLQGEEAAKTYK